MNGNLFNRQDYWRIRWPITIFVICVGLAYITFWGSNSLNDEAANRLRNAQREFNDARSSVELIEEEEATIIEYIDRYNQLAERGIVASEDRLNYLETMARIRSEYDLFPIRLNISQQVGAQLFYPPEESDPGQPISILSSEVSLNMALLHEDDMSRMIDGLLESPGLYQLRDCAIDSRSSTTETFNFLAEHFTLNCSLMWYTFNLEALEL